MTHLQNPKNFHNLAILSANVLEVTPKESANSTPYVIAQAALSGINYTEKNGQNYHPVIEVLAFGKTMPHLKPGPRILIGALKVAESKDEDGQTLHQVRLLARSIQPRQEGDRPRNFVRLSLRIAADAEARMSSRTGERWARVRAFLSMGKKQDGSYRPSLWLTLKAFTRHGDDSLPDALSDLARGDQVDASGGLTCEAYQGRFYWSVVLNSFTVRPRAGTELPQVEEEFNQTEALEAIPD